MKRALKLALAGAPVLLLASCSLVRPTSQSFDPSIDPLDSPGSRKKASEVRVDTGPKFAPGSYVEVTDINAGFYRRYPKGSEQPDHRLATGTPLKVVGSQGSYVKVETEAGQIGYVSAIMVSDKTAPAPVAPSTPVRSAPVPAPVDPIDPGDLAPLPPAAPLPAPGDPFLAPEPEVPPISVEDAPAPGTPDGGPGETIPLPPGDE